MTKTQERFIHFANFAIAHGIKPIDLAELIDLADKAASAAAKENYTGGTRATNARRRFEEKANALGFDADYNGLRPHLVKYGQSNQSIYLPIMNRG